MFQNQDISSQNSFWEVSDIKLWEGIKREVSIDTIGDLTISPISSGPIDFVQENSQKFIPKEYRLTKLLGKGEFGEVFLATSELGKLKVFKRIPKSTQKFRWEYIEREERAREFLGEHKNIISCIARFETSKNVYLVFDYFEGKDLIAYLEDRNYWPLEEKHARNYFRQLITALCYCHSKGVGHRDIKLENILVDKNGNIKLIDFGLCTLQDSPAKYHEDKVGSIDYVAPEVLTSLPYQSWKADVFSAGVVLFCLLFGKFPFQAEERLEEIRMGIRKPINMDKKDRLFSSVSHEAKDLISNMTHPDPNKRYTMDEVSKHKWLK